MRGRFVTWAGAALSVLAALALAHVLVVFPSVGGPSFPGGGDPPTEYVEPEPEPFPVPSGDPDLSGSEQVAQAFETESTPLVRADFGDDAAWDEVVGQVTRSVDLEDPSNEDAGPDGYAPYVTIIDSPDLEGTTGAALAEAATAGRFMKGYVLIADARTMQEARIGGEVTLDYVDLSPYAVKDAELFETFPGNTFRCATSAVAEVEVNLSISNVDFSEFAGSVDPDGVYRGSA